MHLPIVCIEHIQDPVALRSISMHDLVVDRYDLLVELPQP